jgi:hypothetical protein
MEAVLVGISLNLDYLETLPSERIRQMYDELLASEEFFYVRLRQGLSSAHGVFGRMSVAERVFAG